VTLTDRDKKVLMLLAPVLALVAYWFLLLAPKREEASTAAQKVLTQEKRRDAAQAKLDAAESAKRDFSADYTQIVRLGKAIPASVDMPSLIIQLDSAAVGTGIEFTKIKTGERVDETAAATAPPATTPPATTPPADSAAPAAAGGASAQSAPGGAAEAANNTAQAANEQSAGVDTQTGAPGTTPAPPGTTSAPPGLETVPLELEFTGNFFNLADFFHRVKRFVEVADSGVVVGGRLLTIEGVRWSSDPEIFPKVRAEMLATIYLSPLAQGSTAGATPSGPSPTPPATTPTTPAATTPEPAVAPTATATP
jgi:Tfp pilus assembly protein PilO